MFTNNATQNIQNKKKCTPKLSVRSATTDYPHDIAENLAEMVQVNPRARSSARSQRLARAIGEVGGMAARWWLKRRPRAGGRR